jgi:hypothetical protein
LSVALLAAFAISGTALAGGGNSANAKLCQKGGWQNLMSSNAAQFTSEDQCTSYGAQGGAIYALARIEVELSGQQPFDGSFVGTEWLRVETDHPDHDHADPERRVPEVLERFRASQWDRQRLCRILRVSMR